MNLILVLGLLITIMTACEKETETISNFTAAEVESTVETGQWRITNFNDSGKDETYHFNGYRFSFLDTGVLEATNGQSTYMGRWDVLQDSSDDSNDSGLDFNIFFDSINEEFEELTDDWDIVSQSSTRIELIDVSGGNGGTDYLTFEKL